LTYFPKEVNKKSGLASHCRDCDKEHRKKRIENLSYCTPESKICNHCKIEKPCTSEYFHKHNKNKTGFRSICKECRKSKSHSYATSEKYRAKYRQKRKTDPVWKLRKNISVSITNSLRENKERSCFEKLPYTVEELKQHLEKQFEPWMNWDNWGPIRKYTKDNPVWNIDHIIPQSTFEYESMDDEGFQKCWALINLRPLDAVKNIRKSNKIIGDNNG
jgi:hypothetical protein